MYSVQYACTVYSMQCDCTVHDYEQQVHFLPELWVWELWAVEEVLPLFLPSLPGGSRMSRYWTAHTIYIIIIIFFS